MAKEMLLEILKMIYFYVQWNSFMSSVYIKMNIQSQVNSFPETINTRFFH